MSNLENTVLKSMVLGATKKELAKEVPGGLLQMHTVSSGLVNADTCKTSSTDVEGVGDGNVFGFI